MATLTDNTVVVDPKTGLPVPLGAGEQVPAWAVDQVGDHLVDDGDGGTSYADQKVADLRKEVDRRNAGREPSERITLPGGAKSDLVSALEADDAREAETENSGE